MRFAPTLHCTVANLFVGSDDGHAYCISTEGKLIWRKRLAPSDYRIAGNNRIISAWPLRTGILVRDGLAYAGAGMFPSEETVHHRRLQIPPNGKVEKWRTDAERTLPAQGQFTGFRTTVCMCRRAASNPVVYDRATGKHLRTMKPLRLEAARLRVAQMGQRYSRGYAEPRPQKGNWVLGLIPDTERQTRYASFYGQSYDCIMLSKSYLHADLGN